MKLKLLAEKRDLMKASLVKDNYLILNAIISDSLLDFNPMVREKTRGESGCRSWMQREAENKVAQFHLGFPI